MKKFFGFQTDYPVGSGFELYGFEHLMWLFVIGFFCIVSTKWYLQMNNHRRKYVSVLFGSLLPLMGIYRDVVLMVTGHFDRAFLPFHLCSMALWIGAIYVWTRNRFIGVVYLLLCVPGALSALLFPDWSMYPFCNFMHIHAFLSHGGIVCLGVWIFCSGELRPAWKDIWMPVVFGLAGILMMWPINHYLGTNYWFVSSPSPNSPLIFIADLCGNQWYLLGYIVFCFFIIILWLGILRLLCRLIPETGHELIE